MKNLPARLRAARLARDLSQQTVAARTGISQATYSRIERGQRPKRWVLAALDVLLGVDTGARLRHADGNVRVTGL